MYSPHITSVSAFAAKCLWKDHDSLHIQITRLKVRKRILGKAAGDRGDYTFGI